MSVNLYSINANSPISKVQKNFSNNISFRANETDADVFEKQNVQSEKTPEEKQEMVKKARKQGSAWSILFGIFATAYYALRSDKTVAKKYDLDVKQDKNLIRKIKQTQTLWSIPGAFYFGLPAYVLACILDSKNIDVDKTI